MNIVNLQQYKNKNYNPGNVLKRVVWYFVNIIFFKTSIPYPNIIKVIILKLFGAKIEKCINIKPNVNIKYPWFLAMGHNVWIGEGVWIDNLAKVQIGNNVCISQSAFLLTGSHNYKKPEFDLIVKPIIIEDGVWIGAKAIVCPGIICKSHSVLAVGSVAVQDLLEYTIYQGNPAQSKRKRIIN